ncbi:hypothetical protein GCM10017779_41860 [Streptomyces capillispiralis]|nr:hypothetical protein GCM10017779_41860 [Streptomyces capillispiralis]
MVKELRAVLAEAGISLLSLGLDPVSLAWEAPRPLVAPGRRPPRTARRTAAAVMR